MDDEHNDLGTASDVWHGIGQAAAFAVAWF